ncbi:unnamed protein product [Polarella glacialis]|uniref:Calmodulin n=1 Tax=Polarella glacialis TaxID=89957 RepID=A0A813ET03_POLGL|nr:unnamed protein product [Polarella glacialis]
METDYTPHCAMLLESILHASATCHMPCPGFGNLARSWRTIFDPDCTGRCGRMNFAKACKEAGFNGDLKKSWLELGGGSQLRPITLRDLDREADDLLLLFSRALRENHDSVREGWFAFMKAHGTRGRIFIPDFELVCRDMGLGLKEATRLFSYLDKNGDKRVTLDEWLFLSLWEQRRPLSEASSDPGQNTWMSSTAPASAPATAAWPPSPPFGQDLPVDARSAEIAVPVVLLADLPVNGTRNSSAKNGRSQAATSPGDFEFVVVLTQEEHEEYLRLRLRLDLADSALLKPDPCMFQQQPTIKQQQQQ